MVLESAVSVLTLAAVIWVIRFLLPKAVKEHNAFALTCAVLCVVLALVVWLLLGAKTLRSG